MSGKVLILGAKGRFGRAAVTAFAAAGWRVRALARSWDGQAVPPGVTVVDGDAFDADTVTTAGTGCDVIVNALNPPYPRWSRDLPRLTASVIEAARKTGATVMIPGNVYNYGENMPERLCEETPHLPTSRKGRLRETMEAAFAQSGVQTIIVRAGDFIEREKTGNWFDSQIAAKARQGRVLYPGPLDRVHAWAYLPDMARAMAALAGKRAGLGTFVTLGFPGFALTGSELVAAMEQTLGTSMKVRRLPWPLVRVLGLVMPQMREVAEMSYLWHVPHRIDGSKLATLLPDFQATPLEVAMADVLAEHRTYARPSSTARVAA